MNAKTLTPLQRRLFFMALRPAAKDVGEEPEAYRKKILREELGVEHMSEVARGGGFDKLMSRIYQDRGDYVRALDYSMGSFTRLRHIIIKAAERIVADKPDRKGSVYDYIGGVMFQSGMIPKWPTRVWTERLVCESSWLDFSEKQLKQLLMILQSYISRRAK